MVLAMAAEMDWEVVQLDVITAYLHADIEEEVFVEAAPGFERTDKDDVQLLTNLGKSLYGMTQSPWNWWKTIDPLLITLEFVPLRSDTCICIYRKNGIVIILTLYVDDLLVGADIQVIESIKRTLTERFKMTDMGDVSRILGMQVTRDRQNKTPTVKPGELHQVYSGDVWCGELQAYQYSRLRTGALHQTAGGHSSEMRKRRNGNKPLRAR